MSQELILLRQPRQRWLRRLVLYPPRHRRGLAFEPKLGGKHLDLQTTSRPRLDANSARPVGHNTTLTIPQPLYYSTWSRAFGLSTAYNSTGRTQALRYTLNKPLFDIRLGVESQAAPRPPLKPLGSSTTKPRGGPRLSTTSQPSLFHKLVSAVWSRHARSQYHTSVSARSVRYNAFIPPCSSDRQPHLYLNRLVPSPSYEYSVPKAQSTRNHRPPSQYSSHIRSQTPDHMPPLTTTPPPTYKPYLPQSSPPT